VGWLFAMGCYPNKRSARNFSTPPGNGFVPPVKDPKGIESFSPVLADLPRRNWMKADSTLNFQQASTRMDTELNNQGTKTRNNLTRTCRDRA